MKGVKDRNLQHPRFLDQHCGDVSLPPPQEAVCSGTGRYGSTRQDRMAKTIHKITEQFRQMGGAKALLQWAAQEQIANHTSLEPIVDSRLRILFEN